MKKKYFLFILILTLLLTILLFNNSFAADPKLISTMKNAFEKIENWLIKLATPTAAVAVCSGLFIQKFRFGDEEKIRLGKKLVKNSLFSYAFILVINLVLSAIESLVG